MKVQKKKSFLALLVCVAAHSAHAINGKRMSSVQISADAQLFPITGPMGSQQSDLIWSPTPTQTDKSLYLPVDPVTGKPYLPTTGQIVDSAGNPIGKKAGFWTEPFDIDSAVGLPYIKGFGPRVFIDPITHMLFDNLSGRIYEKKNGRLIMGSKAGIKSKSCGTLSPSKSDPFTGNPIDPSIGLPFNAQTGEITLFGSKKSIKGTRACSSTVSIQKDAFTGFNLDDNTGFPLDPYSSCPIDPITKELLDKLSGTRIPGSTPGYSSPHKGQESTKIDEETGLPIDPAIHLPCNTRRQIIQGQVYNPSRLSYIPNTKCLKYADLTVPDKEQITTVAPGEGEQTTVAPGEGEQSTDFPGEGEQTTVAPGEGEQSTEFPGEGEQTTVAPGEGEQSTEFPGEGEQTTVAPGEGEATTLPSTEGENSTVFPGQDETTTSEPFEGEQTTVAPNEGEQSTEFPGEGEQTTVAPGEGEITTLPSTEGEMTTSEATTAAPGEDTEGATEEGSPEEGFPVVAAAGGAIGGVVLIGLGAGGYVAVRRRGDGEYDEEDDEYVEGFVAELDGEGMDSENIGETVINIDRESSFWNDSQ